MQETKKNISKEKVMKFMKNKKILIILIVIIILASCIITITTQTIKRRIKEIATKPILEYEIKDKKSNNKYELLVKINSVDGIETVKYISSITGEEVQLNCNGKMTVGIDYEAEDQKSYEFKVKIKGKEEKLEELYFEIPRIKGNYTLSNGLYVNEPDITNYNSNYTRYLNINDNGNLEVGNWISGDKPQNWYDYKNNQWANIYVEKNGLENYYVWIPRYCFKLNQENQISDVKFIDVYDNYKDENGNVISWKQLEVQGYQIPQAFEFNNTQIPGYWANKYTAGERDIYTVDFEGIASKTKLHIKEISTDTTDTISKYVYAIDGKIVKESTINENFTYAIEEEKEYVLNVTLIGENGKIVGSMTKEATPAKVNKPDLSGFNPETTFYVTYDENGIEYSTIPITEDEPNDWYDYGDTKWANIVTRNNELETYYVWIPRYEFKVNQTSQRTYINFIEGINTEATKGYQIPEAFTYNNQELSGYWANKYTAGTEATLRFDTEVVATNSSIRTKGIIGSAKSDGQVYKYYIDGEYKGERTSANDIFEYSELNSNTKYTILVEIRNKETNEYLGTIVKQITTIDANKPDLSGFSEENTYYVLYDNDGNASIGDKVKKDGSNMPNNWYNYSQSKWANIVVKENGMETYYTWIPRYEYMATSSQYVQATQGRTEVRFIDGISTDVDIGYQIPEAFKFNDQELTGYWAMKYTAGQ